MSTNHQIYELLADLSSRIAIYESISDLCKSAVKENHQLKDDMNRIGQQVDKIRYAMHDEIEKKELLVLLAMFDPDSADLLPQEEQSP